MKNAKTVSLVVIALVAASLAGCQNVKRELGIGRNSPDEFMVVKRAPLTLPPEYALRAPSDGSMPAASETTQAARAALLGTPETPVEGGTGESALLSKMGASAADPEIRSTINRENGYIALENRTVADKLIFWKDAPPESETMPTSEVNAKGEYERIKKNREEGKAVNEGDVPVIEKKQSTVDKLF